uniref:ATP synthase F0 subunit 6 n=1 Tax=Paradiplozoon yunnanensis TaxID=2268894 RepID=UPI001FAFAD1B
LFVGYFGSFCYIFLFFSSFYYSWFLLFACLVYFFQIFPFCNNMVLFCTFFPVLVGYRPLLFSVISLFKVRSGFIHSVPREIDSLLGRSLLGFIIFFSEYLSRFIRPFVIMFRGVVCFFIGYIFSSYIGSWFISNFNDLGFVGFMFSIFFMIFITFYEVFIWLIVVLVSQVLFYSLMNEVFVLYGSHDSYFDFFSFFHSGSIFSSIR